MSEALGLFNKFGTAAVANAVCSPPNITRFANYLTMQDRQLSVRFVRGQRMCRERDVLDEFAAAWQFPWYYGRNWNAFGECISDLSWIGESKLLTIVLDSEQLLREAEGDALSVFMRIMASASEEIADPNKYSDLNSRPGRWFRTILHCDPNHEQEWQKRFSDFRSDIRQISISESCPAEIGS